MPIPIIVSNFSEYHKNEKRKENLLKQKTDLLNAHQIGDLLKTDLLGSDDTLK